MLFLQQIFIDFRLRLSWDLRVSIFHFNNNLKKSRPKIRTSYLELNMVMRLLYGVSWEFIGRDSPILRWFFLSRICWDTSRFLWLQYWYNYQLAPFHSQKWPTLKSNYMITPTIRSWILTSRNKSSNLFWIKPKPLQSVHMWKCEKATHWSRKLKT